MYKIPLVFLGDYGGSPSVMVLTLTMSRNYTQLEAGSRLFMAVADWLSEDKEGRLVMADIATGAGRVEFHPTDIWFRRHALKGSMLPYLKAHEIYEAHFDVGLEEQDQILSLTEDITDHANDKPMLSRIAFGA